MNQWPLQSECNKFYGDPRGPGGHASPKWEANNLVKFIPPWQMYYAGKPLQYFRIHKKCHDSLARIFGTIAAKADHMPQVLNRWGVTVFGGSYNYRLIRGSSSRLSMHAYGCSIDLDPERNAMGDKTPNFALCKEVLDAFAYEGWVWGGHWTGRPDAMHWQAARVG